VLRVDDELKNLKGFSILLALTTNDGLVGPYREWVLDIASGSPSSSPPDILDAVALTGAGAIQEQRPDASFAATTPQVAQVIDIPAVVPLSMPVTLGLALEGAEPAAVQVVMSAPCTLRHVTTQVFSTRTVGDTPVLDISLTVTDADLVGSLVVVLLAVTGQDGTTSGYIPAGFKVVKSLDPDATNPLQAGALPQFNMPSSTYTLGCTSEDSHCEMDERGLRVVTLPPFSLSVIEVTRSLYHALTGKWKGGPSKCAACPVNMVTWQEAWDFCAMLGGRLPSEAQWEYAARAGTTSTYGCGNEENCLDTVAWWKVDQAHEVATREPNAWGIYDMSGNAWEWVADNYHPTYADNPADGSAYLGQGSGEKVVRGGSFGVTESQTMRLSNRARQLPESVFTDVGFRCVR